MTFTVILGVIACFAWLAAKQASIKVWAIIGSAFTLLAVQYASLSMLSQIILFSALILLYLSLYKPIRRKLISQVIFNNVRNLMPKMSKTERDALEAGTVGWDAELFSGNPNFSKLLAEDAFSLSKEEQDFLDGPVQMLCRMINDWDITHNRTDLPPEIWHFIKEQGFFGMIIPKKYGGLEFSATAQAKILITLYGRSVSVATTVGVPNSLGPGELLLKYGTDEQKNYYLPRLAKGIDIPCFALTGPNAGSDAASIPDTGLVCKQLFNGQQTLGIRLNWDKRYITLCPVATVIGLAFRLFDPNNLLGKGDDIGITCALIPADTQGVVKGRRHYPLNTAFMNGPTQGEDVFIPLEYVIGGEAMVGEGWRMLMECLSAGRAISLPSSAVGGMQLASLATGAYARIRRQFNTSIANFEGIEEPLARIAGATYYSDAALMMTVAAIDRGAKPSVAGAILKYHTTERARKIVMDAMDVHGGKGICLGPNNYLGRGYQQSPIGITVEGANILTRNLIIFGQGAIRCHPFVYKEMESIRDNNLNSFDQALWGHVAFIMANLTKSICFSFTNGYLTRTPNVKLKHQFQMVHKYSTHLAFLTDFAMVVLGGTLKRREKMSARLGDMLSYLYILSAVLLRFQHEGEPEADLPLVKWCCYELLYETEKAMEGFIANFPKRWARVILRCCVLPFGPRRKRPSDDLGHKVAQLLSTPNETRERLTRLVFCEPSENSPIGELEETFQQVFVVAELEKKLIQAVKSGEVQSLNKFHQIDKAQRLGILTKEEAKQLNDLEHARQKIIAVDDFDDSELRRSEKRQPVSNQSEIVR